MKPKRALMNGTVSAARDGGGAVRETIMCFWRSAGGMGRKGRSLGWSVICWIGLGRGAG
jgi:hypothetical protein